MGRPDRWVVEDTRGSVFGTRHPWWFVGAGAVLSLAGGPAIELAPPGFYSTGFDLAVVVVFIAIGSVVAAPGVWSLRHRALAARAADRNWRKQADFLHDHRTTAFVVLPLLAGAGASYRAHEFWRHPSLFEHLLLGLAAAAVAVLIQAVVAVATRRLRARG